MNIQENVDLSDYSTMRLGGKTRYLAHANSEQELQELIAWAKTKSLSFMPVGRGSNIVWRDEGYDGLIIAVRIPGRQIISESETSATVRLGAGENWDEVVEWTVDAGLSGIEFLSLIPGRVGAAPIQNIGAYGAELADSLIEVEAFDTTSDSLISILKQSCGFDYRTSRFKTTDKGQFIITGIVLELKKSNPTGPFYESLQEYLDAHNIHQFSPTVIRQAVIAVRQSKLPDPEKIYNNGSFFTNPFVTKSQFDTLKLKHPDVVGWPTNDKLVKLSAGWLVEKAGFKGIHDAQTGMATYDKQALVLVNEHAHSTADLLTFKQKIIDGVNQLFGVTLEQEPELLP